jgi:origin recognition complex subunit 4
MDDSPRSSKRRKLDPPKRIASSPLVKTATKRSSGRLTNRSASYSVGNNGEESAPKRLGRPAKTKRQATLADIDIYDDIEGAMSVDLSPRPRQRQFKSASLDDTAGSTDELQQFEEDAIPPKREKSRLSATRSAFKSLVNGYKPEAEEGAEAQDELAAETLTPTTRAKRTQKPAVSARKAVVPRSSDRKRAANQPVRDDENEDQELHVGTNGTTPSKGLSSRSRSTAMDKQTAPEEDEEPTAASPSRSSKRRQAVRRRSTISETEQELVVSNKRPTVARRQTNRADNTNNRDDEQSLEEDIQPNGSGDDTMDMDGNSILGSVLDPTEPSPFNKPTSTHKHKAAPALISGNILAGRHLDLLKTIVLERITAKRPSPLVGLEEEYKTVHQLIEQTVTAGEGNSMLVIGARGSGKTALVNKVLSEISKDNGGEYHVVRLNGFIHTDDKIALREIWRQMGREMDIEEDGSGPGKNYADTLTTLLALLSHPSEQTGELTDQVAKAVIFVMDEFDLFAQHPRQTLLYNLFDIAQSRKAPIAVLGLTTRIDVTNSLEKRVKSRFSHRYVHLSLAKSFTSFQEICKACLTVQTEHMSIEERGILEGSAEGTPGKKGKKETKQDILTEWNGNISKLFASPSFLTQHLAPAFYRTKSVPAVLNTFLLPTAALGPDTPFEPLNFLSAPDSKLSLVPHLSTLALSLLISTARLDIIHDSDTCNFNMAYDEYVTLASKARIQSAAGGFSASGSVSKVWGKDVARREWEELVELGLVMPVIQGQAGGFGMIRCDVALEEIGAVLAGEKGLDRQLERWCKSI